MSPPPDGGAANPVDLRLRPNAPRVMRLSRKFLLGLGIIGGVGLGATLMFAFQPQPTKSPKATAPDYSVKTKPVAERFNALPKDYSGVPQLGAPLPGDIGKAMYDAKQNGQENGTTVPGVTGTASASPASSNPASSAATAPSQQPAQRAATEAEQLRQTAHTSQLFPSGHNVSTTDGAQLPLAGTAAIAPELAALASPIQADTKSPQDKQTAFLNQTPDRITVSPDRLQAPASPYLLQAGTIIPAALITGLRSDLPGQVTAQVSENVYDSLTGRYLLIPQGARLIGQYDNAVAFGQSRVLLAWTRLILPNGQSLVLEKLSAADAQGMAGLSDSTDYHWAGMIQAAAISTLLSVGAEAGSSERDSDIVRALRAGASDSISRTGQQIVERQLNIQPTLTIRAGFPVRVILSRDIVLEPYGGR